MVIVIITLMQIFIVLNLTFSTFLSDLGESPLPPSFAVTTGREDLTLRKKDLAGVTGGTASMQLVGLMRLPGTLSISSQNNCIPRKSVSDDFSLLLLLDASGDGE